MEANFDGWSIDVNLNEVPQIEEMPFSGDYAPAKPEQVHPSTRIMNRTSAGLTLDEAFVAFDLRESFLQRHASPMAMHAEATDLETKNFATKSVNMWSSPDQSLQPANRSCAAEGNIYEEKYSRMEQHTQSMFCPQANVIAPLSDSRNRNALIQDINGDGQHDVILEADENGNTFLHLVMPASAVNFLNGSDGSSLFDFEARTKKMGSNFETDESEFDDVFVELGCKVYEVNKVYYRGDSHRPTENSVINA